MGALSDSPRPGARRALLLAAFGVVLLAACGSDTDAQSGPISISDAWALATAVGQPNGAVYFTVMSPAEDTLERVSVPDAVADHAELHEEITTASGAMVMQEMESGVPLGPGEAVTFTPGGKHAMLVELARPLIAGQSFEVTLEFARSDPITLPVAVVESPP